MGDELRLKPSKWARDEMVPVARASRNMGTWAFTALWITMSAQLGVFTLGASLVEDLTVPEALLAVALANLAMVVLFVLIGDIGIEHGVNFAGYLRAPFGMFGSYLPLALRGLAGVAWFGIQTWLGATAIDVVTREFFDFSALPVWYVALGVVEIALVVAGLDVLKRVVSWSGPALIVLSIVILYVLLSRESWSALIDHTPDGSQPFLVGMVAAMSYWTTVAINLPDFTRRVKAEPARSFLRRNRRSAVAQLLGVPSGMLLFTLVGMVGFVFHGDSNPVLAIAATVGGVALVIALSVVVLAQVTTNITANLVASAYAANAIGSPKVSYRVGAVITGVLGLLTLPWALLDYFLVYLPALGAALAPVAGIMIADYYLLRRRRLDLPALFDPVGQYRYWRGVNPAALIAWGAGAAAGIIWLDYSLLLAFPIGLGLYWLLMRAWVLRIYPQPEVDGGGDLATSVDRDWPVTMR